MDSTCLISAVQAGLGGVRDISWHTLGPLLWTEYHLNTFACLSVAADHVHLLMAGSQSELNPIDHLEESDLYHAYIANKSAAHVWCFHSNMDYNLQGMFQAPWHVELRQIWKQTGAQPRTSNLIMQVGLDNNNSLCKCLSLLHNLTMGEIKRTSVWVSDVE